MVPDLLILALDYARAPLRYTDLADPLRPLPASFENLVGAFGSALSPRNIESTSNAVGMRPDEVEAASRFFLRQVLMSPRSSHYRVLGLAENASAENIRQHYQLLVGIFHPDRSADDTGRNEAYTARINEAYNLLKNPAERRKYDEHLVSVAKRRVEDAIAARPKERTSYVPPVATGAESGPGVPFRSSRSGLLVVAGVVVAALITTIAIMVTKKPPLLRANPELADESVTDPTFLKERAFGTNHRQEPSSTLPSPGGDTAQTMIAMAPRPASRNEASTVATSSAQVQASDLGARERIRESARRMVPQAVEGTNKDEAGSSHLSSLQIAEEPPETDRKPNRTPPPRTAPVPEVSTVPVVGTSEPAANLKVARLLPDDAKDERPAHLPATGPAREAQCADGVALDAEECRNPAEKQTKTASIPPAGAQATEPDHPPKPPRSGSAATSKPPPTRTKDVRQAKSVRPDGEKKPEPSSPKQAKNAKDKKRSTLASREASQTGKEDAGRSKRVSKTTARPKADPDETVARLTHYYRTGNLDGFVGLFTSNARVNDGSGKGFIRKDYARFFAKAKERRLSIGRLKWSSAANGRMTAKGVYRVSFNDAQKGKWVHSSGKVSFELVPWMSGYKISKMIHR